MRMNLPVSAQEYLVPEDEVIVTHTDVRGLVVYANEAFVRSSGYNRQEIMGQPHNFVRHPDMPAEAFADLWATAKSGKAWTGIVKNRRKDGSFYWVRANVTPINKNGQITGFMSVRVKPTVAEIAGATKLYAAIREGKEKNIRLSGGEVIRTDVFGLFSRLMRLPMRTRLWMLNGSIAAFLAVSAVVQWVFGTGPSAMISATASIIGYGLLLAVTMYLIKQVAAPISAMMETSVRVCGGDVNAQLPEIGDRDLRHFSKLVNQMNAKIGGVVMDAHCAMEIMSRSTEEVAHGNLDLSSRTEEQASSLEQTASAMEELTGTVKQNADNARQANQLASGASEVAVSGGTVVRHVVDTMSEISASSRKIADIIGVIDSIAFQTNILALNAAVEAARAGEQGRGFAVVATEVRNLAQRSALAAKEIKGLITDSAEKVEAGTQLVDQAGKTMDEVVSSIKRVTDIMAEINAASHEQSTGIEQVSSAVSQMDEVTQQNASLVEEAAAAAESLKEQADLIMTALSVFNFNETSSTARQNSSGNAEKKLSLAHAGMNRQRPSFQPKSGKAPSGKFQGAKKAA